MGTIAEQQDANVVPPRRGKVLAFTVDSTARPYDLHALALGDASPEAAESQKHELFVTLAALGCTVYYQFATATHSDIDETAAIAAGGAAAFDDTFCVPLPDGAREGARIVRSLDRFIILKAASGLTGKFYLWPSSDEQ